MALRFVSTRSGSGVGAQIGLLQALRLYPSVGLGRADRRMPEELLDRAQVGAPLEQVGGERVAQGVRRDPAPERGATRRDAQPAPHVGGGQPAAALREEQGGVV